MGLVVCPGMQAVSFFFWGGGGIHKQELARRTDTVQTACRAECETPRVHTEYKTRKAAV